MSRPIKIIDLFAGPGGLGEGFSAFRTPSGDAAFKIALSIEMDSSAHKTLTLRSFYRQFSRADIPREYHEFVAGERGKYPEDDLYGLAKFRKEVTDAQLEARKLTLGKDNRAINKAISESLGKRPGPWILIGGPPCQAYSLVGRSRNRGNTEYKPEEDHRNYLYREYLKVLARFAPDVFVMENVKGMLSATVDGKNIFTQIRNDLECPARALKTKDKRVSYELFPFVDRGTDSDLFESPVSPKDFVIKSELYGVPQNRHRVLVLGVRTDRLSRTGVKPLQQNLAPSVSDVIGDLPRLRSGLSKGPDSLGE